MKQTMSFTIEADPDAKTIDVNIFHENDAGVKSSSFKLKSFTHALEFVASYVVPLTKLENFEHRDAAQFPPGVTSIPL